MIEKLKSKIFILMFTSLSIIIVGIIILFAVFNCSNTVRASRMSIDRVTRMREGPARTRFTDKTTNSSIYKWRKWKSKKSHKKYNINFNNSIRIFNNGNLFDI